MTSWLPQFTQIKRLLFFCVRGATQASLWVDRFPFFSIVFNLSASFPSLLCLSSISAAASFFFSLHVAWRHHSWARRPGGAVLLCQTPDHRAAGSVLAAFIVFGLCPVIKGVSVILAIEMLEKLLVSAGERICGKLICVLPRKSKMWPPNHYHWHLLLCSVSVNGGEIRAREKFTLFLQSMDFLFFAFVICSCFSPPLNFPGTISVLVMVSLSAGVYFNFSVLLIWL